LPGFEDGLISFRRGTWGFAALLLISGVLASLLPHGA
jgi:hypothetical protein